MMVSLCSDVGALYWAIRIAGLLGLALLAVPVLAADRKYRDAAGFAKRTPGDIDPAFKQIRNSTAQELWDRAGRWSRGHSYCLWTGYALLLSSSVGAFIADLGCS